VPCMLGCQMAPRATLELTTHTVNSSHTYQPASAPRLPSFIFGFAALCPLACVAPTERRDGRPIFGVVPHVLNLFNSYPYPCALGVLP